MRILVIDDNATHRTSAKNLLKGHDVTIVGAYDDAQKALAEGKFEVYLGDLMLPASAQAQASKKHVGEQMPLGTTLALLAMMHGVKYVAVLTDTNHHEHPASAAFDAFQWGGRSGKAFVVGDTRVVCGQDDFMCFVDEETGERVAWGFLQSDEGKKKYPEISWGNHQGAPRVKDWARALKVLTDETKKT